MIVGADNGCTIGGWTSRDLVQEMVCKRVLIKRASCMKAVVDRSAFLWYFTRAFCVMLYTRPTIALALRNTRKYEVEVDRVVIPAIAPLPMLIAASARTLERCRKSS